MAIDPDELTLEQLTDTYPHAVVDFVLTAQVDAALNVPDLVPVEVLTPAGADLEVRTNLTHVATYADAVRAAGCTIVVTMPAAVPA